MWNKATQSQRCPGWRSAFRGGNNSRAAPSPRAPSVCAAHTAAFRRMNAGSAWGVAYAARPTGTTRGRKANPPPQEERPYQTGVMVPWCPAVAACELCGRFATPPARGAAPNARGVPPGLHACVHFPACQRLDGGLGRWMVALPYPCAPSQGNRFFWLADTYRCRPLCAPRVLAWVAGAPPPSTAGAPLSKPHLAVDGAREAGPGPGPLVAVGAPRARALPAPRDCWRWRTLALQGAAGGCGSRLCSPLEGGVGGCGVRHVQLR